MNCHSIRSGLLCSLLLACLPAAAEVYQCGEPGKLIYTDRPCADGEKLELRAPVVVEPPSADAARDYDRRIARERGQRDAADAAWLEQHDERRAREERIRAARIAREAVEGMSPADVRHALGEPDQVSSGDRSERWTYRRDDGGRHVVSFRDGTVSAVASSEGGRSKRRSRRD
ncbi:MAG TPA: DUF4124 domain-containing protein [Solimonas sp.]|nr:DUF4124 domain-containing protein [Solimonas sp.]